MSKKGNKLKCKICGTDLEVPLCCDKEMLIKGNILICSLCGLEETIPICCGISMNHYSE